MFNILKKIFGTKHDRDFRMMLPVVRAVADFEEKMKSLTSDELRGQTKKFIDLLRNGSTQEDILPEAFATVRETAVRFLKMRPFDVQIMGGMVLFNGKIAEMKTGEGKTLCATLPLYLIALEKKGSHVVTVNDYLAVRDSSEMGVLFEALDISVGCITNDMNDEERKQAYRADITYGTNNEFTFDYLRDNMKFTLEDYVQRDHHYCIVDEVDSILIDEARTPLLISGPNKTNLDLYRKANTVIPALKISKDFTIDEKAHTVFLSDDGILSLQKILKIENLFDGKNVELLHHFNQALKAHHLFKINTDYVVKNGKVIIVDEFTGRLKEGSRWSDGLHQAVEAKEGVQIRQENQTLASITFQNYFKLYSKLSGMTGTADTEAEEFSKIYNLEVIVISTNLPLVRLDHPDVIYKSVDAKFNAVSKLIQTLHEKGQPVLVGTISIESSERLSQLLRKNKIPHEILNAKQHEREAQIIVDAGQLKSVTIATNMAGRGTDIKLSEGTKKAGGLFILGTERHESRRIDNQLRGRSGRQGDRGESKFFLSLEDDLMRIFGSDRIKSIMNTLGMEENEPIEHRMISNAIAKAQKKVEGHNFEIRKHLLDYDNVMNEQRRVIYRLRKEILSDHDNKELIDGMIEDVIHLLIADYKPEEKVPLKSWAWSEMRVNFQKTFFTDHRVIVEECLDRHAGVLDTYLFSTASETLRRKLVKYPTEQVRLAVREILLSTFDHHWKDHLLSMDHLKEGINLRAYAQKDPLTEYKRESFVLFEQMRIDIKRSVVRNIFSVELYTEEEIDDLKKRHRDELKKLEDLRRRSLREKERGQIPLKNVSGKVGRNDPCPCASGKKYKQCHGK